MIQTRTFRQAARRLALSLVVLVASCASEQPEQAQTPPAGPAPWTRPIPAADSDSAAFTFAIVADRTGGARPGIFEDAVRKLNLLQPDFVMSVGDLIQGYTTDDAEIDRQWDEFDAIVQRLDMPFVYLAGNHDLTNSVMLKHWQKRRGSPFFHFVHSNVLFLCLCTENPEAGLHQQQLDYARQTLRNNADVRWTFVFLHQPVWQYNNISEWEEIEKLLGSRPATVFAGHRHCYLKVVRNGRELYALGTTGGGSDLTGESRGMFDHLTWVTMTDSGPRIANLALDGIHDRNVRTPQTAALVNGLDSGTAIAPDAFLSTSRTFTRLHAGLRIRNDANGPLELHGSFQPHPKLITAPNRLDVTIPPGSTHETQLAIAAAEPVDALQLPPLQMDWRARWELATEGGPDDPPRQVLKLDGTRRFRFDMIFQCPLRTEAVKIDGDLSDWPDLPITCERPAQILLAKNTWTGPLDSSFSFAVARDDAFLYLAARVIDDNLVVEHNSDPWFQDGIEVRLDARPPGERLRGPYKAFQDYLLVALSPGAGPEQLTIAFEDKQPEGLAAACVATDKGYNAEIAIPIGYLEAQQGARWETFRLNIAVNDFDGPHGDGANAAQIWWRPDWSRNQNYAESGTFSRNAVEADR